MGTPASGDVDFAPQHDGLEGNKLATLAIALDIVPFPDAVCGSCYITNSYGSSNSFPSGDSWISKKATTIARRTLGVEPVGSAHFYRLNLSGSGNGYWNVWFPENIASII